MSSVSTLLEFNPANYIIDPTELPTSTKMGGRFNSSRIVTYADGSEWVVLADKQKDRFNNFVYLEQAIKENGLQHVHAAKNRLA